MRAAAHPRSPLCARGTLPGVLDGQAGSASFPGHKRRRCRPALRRPFLLNRRIVPPPRGCSASPSLTCHTVAASRAWEGRSLICTQHGRVLDTCAEWLQEPGVSFQGSAALLLPWCSPSHLHCLLTAAPVPQRHTCLRLHRPGRPWLALAGNCRRSVQLQPPGPASAKQVREGRPCTSL